jgi:hypothetical protein
MRIAEKASGLTKGVFRIGGALFPGRLDQAYRVGHRRLPPTSTSQGPSRWRNPQARRRSGAGQPPEPCVSRCRFPGGSKGGKRETPPQSPAAVQFRSLVGGHTPKNRRISLKCLGFRLSWAVSAVGSGGCGASWGRLARKVFRDPAATPGNPPARTRAGQSWSGT